jgi:hypothetical protein
MTKGLSIIILLFCSYFCNAQELDSTKVTNFYVVKAINSFTQQIFESGGNIHNWEIARGWIVEYESGKTVISLDKNDAPFIFYREKKPYFDTLQIREDKIKQQIISYNAIDEDNHKIDVTFVYPESKANENETLMIIHDFIIFRYAIEEEEWQQE